MSDYKNVRRAPQDLASGRVLAPGETVAAADLDLEEGSHDQGLIDRGVLIDARAREAETPVLVGEALQDRARELDIPGRTTKTAEELRAAVAEAEAALAAETNDDSQEA